MIINSQIRNLLLRALQEDIGSGDLTTRFIVPRNQKSKAIIISKSEGVLAGLEVVTLTFKLLDSKVKFKIFKKDGDKIKKGDKILEIYGKTQAILSGERTALNILQRLSGIATLTFQFVRQIQSTSAKICDTRKTIPLWRSLEKYAVKIGGGTNHRFGLYDMILIKDNHIKAAGSITEAVKLAKQKNKRGLLVEVETKNLTEVREALKVGANFIMLDNFSLKNLKLAVKIIRDFEQKNMKKIKIEASGNVSLKNVKKIAQTGVNLISVGKITHSAPALDFSLKIL